MHPKKKYYFIKTLFLLFLSFYYFKTNAQSDDFETKEWTATSTDKPIIFYISGDGGFNNFSSGLCETLNKQGYGIVALNAKNYFWDKKTPAQTTSDIENYLIKKIASRNNKKIMMIGYSFGADVLPFVLTRFSANMNQNLVSSILMAPSGSTDFEIHWTDMFGGNKKRDMDVVSEINKVTGIKLVHISGDDDAIDETKIKIKTYVHETLPGGHHFDGNTSELARVIMKYIN